MNRLFGLVAALAVASTAHAQGMVVNTPNGQVQVGVWGFEGHHGNHFVENVADHRLDIVRDRWGRTRIKVLAPEGAVLHVYKRHQEIYADEVPTVFDAQPNERYRLEVVMQNGAVWRRHVETRRGAVAKLWVLAPSDEMPPPQAYAPQPPPTVNPVVYAPAPQPMEPRRFAALADAIHNESFPQQQMDVLRTAAGRDYFTVAQVGHLVDLFSFPHDKVEAVRLMRPHVLDPQNAFQLSSHFDFPNDKQTVQRMFQ